MNDPSTITVLSPAKINLYLRVGPARADGFHSLVSWFCSLGLADEMRIEASDSQEVTLTCDQADVPCDGRNLILKAALALGPFARHFRGAHITLTKRIPMGGGLGGGSSNGAKALQLLARWWTCQIDAAELAQLAGRLGSDVPFFLSRASAICRGRGELITSFPKPHPNWCLLLLPDIAMPTPAVYQRFDQMKLGTDLALVEQSLPSGSADTLTLLSLLVNDLEAPAFAISPALARLRSEAETALNRPVRMSGSGSTLFTLYDDQSDAEAAASTAWQRLGVRALAARLCPEVDQPEQSA